MENSNNNENSQVLDLVEKNDFIEICNVILEEKVMKLNEENNVLKKELALEKLISRQSGKLASLGEMYSTLLHEIKNPLMSLTSRISKLSKMVNLSESDLHDIEVITKASQNIQGIVKNILNFSRKSNTTSWGAIEINEVINDTFIIMFQQIRVENIKLILELGNDLPGIWGEKNLTQSIFQNLIINSKDAFLDVRDEREKFIKISTQMTSDESIEVVYSDNACGIDTETMNHLFEPFFTTKEEGKGTGLGLTTMKNIIHDMEGNITVESQKDVGTTFKMLFPTFGSSLNNS